MRNAATPTLSINRTRRRHHDTASRDTVNKQCSADQSAVARRPGPVPARQNAKTTVANTARATGVMRHRKLQIGYSTTSPAANSEQTTPVPRIAPVRIPPRLTRSDTQLPRVHRSPLMRPRTSRLSDAERGGDQTDSQSTARIRHAAPKKSEIRYSLPQQVENRTNLR